MPVKDLDHPVSLSDFDAMAPAVVQQDLVELGTPHLVRVGILAAGFPEIPAPRLRVLAPNHGGSPLGQEPGAFNGGKRAQLLQHGDAGRQERFADVVARETLPFEKQDRYTLPGQHGGRSAACRATANDYDVGVKISSIRGHQEISAVSIGVRDFKLHGSNQKVPHTWSIVALCEKSPRPL